MVAAPHKIGNEIYKIVNLTLTTTKIFVVEIQVIEKSIIFTP